MKNVRFVAYIDLEGTQWPPPRRPPGAPVVIEVDPDIQFEDAVAQAFAAAGGSGEIPYYWPHLLRDSSSPHPENVPFPQVGIDASGELIWTEGNRSTVTLADLQRAREAGLSEGDPRGVFLERPLYGDGVIPGWEELLRWLHEVGVEAAAGAFVALVAKHYTHWRNRGALSPPAFLHLVTARDEWDLDELRRLLGMKERDARALLESLGFERQPSPSRRWLLSPNASETSPLRRLIIQDYLHRNEEKPSDYREYREDE